MIFSLKVATLILIYYSQAVYSVPVNGSEFNATGLVKRGLSICFKGDVEEVPLCKLQKDYWRYTFVGYHGSCSNYKNSLEKQVMLPKTGQTFDKWQIGSRFYVADLVSRAFEYAESACITTKKTSKGTENLQPILCSIYAKSSVLKSAIKVYVPEYPIAGKRDRRLWYHDQNMEWWETQLLGESLKRKSQDHSKIIRVAKILGREDFQTAWPEELLESLKAKCVVISPEIYQMDLDQLRTARYAEMLRGNENQSWGDILGRRRAPF
ncbi:hypothetical protein BKA69DRAFT_121591 [Paraphysoderma sedebokerense]|nr:hypothetical protein BKA69DRAFT_121591 [Paraphysoderma sedebokerense]